MQKLSRSNARLSLRVEDLEKKVEGGFAELRGQLSAPPPRPTEQRPDELFDALDALDEACLNTRLLQPELAEGLSRVARRLEQVALKHYVRIRPHGQPPDGRLFKVVGGVAAPEVAEGLVARVVRAAITTRDGSTVREGEVLTSRKDA